MTKKTAPLTHKSTGFVTDITKELISLSSDLLITETAQCAKNRRAKLPRQIEREAKTATIARAMKAGPTNSGWLFHIMLLDLNPQTVWNAQAPTIAPYNQIVKRS